MDIITLNNISDVEGARYKSKKKGRGIGSSKGKTCGRGVKGQKSRSGVSIKTEGGQMPLIKRLPKRGFNPINKKIFQIVTLENIEQAIVMKKIDIKNVIDNQVLFSVGLIKKVEKPVKLLVGSKNFSFTHKINVKLSAFSSSVKKALWK